MMLLTKTISLLLLLVIGASASASFARQESVSAENESATAYTSTTAPEASGTTVVTSELTAARLVQTIIDEAPYIVEVSQEVVWTITTTIAPEVTTEAATSVA
ncbi:uncharacterized protein SCHCODRAFT_02646141 [Schizophyllum commune H4-8]|uniref:uncharacterized protein n=1 Tax=Schizophyllum commune (strain H4-8 / FGSC 9210) TaxID=578458 RepID=UPI00215E08ED|nr:uncharacterized protein SCHCODRAFT_02646141 [Schizophyllum commune H4-8]KAI5836565.1 hypothetical protein SCHCODRAFT_02646141 [Schizophyllum commune H4-8]